MRSRALWAITPARGTRTPKNATKNGGWAMKLLRQQTTATAAVPPIASSRVCRRVRLRRTGNRPSGKSTTAHRYATPDTTWNMKCTALTGQGSPSTWKTSWLGSLNVAAVPMNASASSIGTTPGGRLMINSRPSARLSPLNRYARAQAPSGCGAIAPASTRSA